MKLLELDIKWLPGLTDGFCLKNIGTGDNFVIGPNAAGKSSLLRALRYLLTPPQANDPKLLHLAALFAHDGATYRVQRIASEVIWERDGRSVEPPAMPSAHQLPCYWFAMDGLISAGKEDELLLSELRRALWDGYDIGQLATKEPFELKPKRGLKLAADFAEATRKVRGIEQKYAEYRQEEHLLPELKAKLAAARLARDEIYLYQNALNLWDANAELRQAAAQLEAFHPCMPRLRGDETLHLETLHAQRRKGVQELAAKEAQRTRARQVLAATGLAAKMPRQMDLDLADKDLEQMRLDQQSLAGLEARRLQIKVAEENALANLGATRRAPKLDPASLAQAEVFLADLQRKEAECRQLEVVDPPPATPVPPERLQKLRSACQLLNAWLQGVEGAGALHQILMGISACGWLAAVAVALWTRSWLLAGVATAAALSSAAMLLNLTWVRGGRLRREYQKLGLKSPAPWNAATVTAYVRDCEQQLATACDEDIKAARRAESVRRHEIARRELDAWRQKKQRLCDALGFDPELTVAALDRSIRLIAAYESAKNERLQLDAESERLRSAMDIRARRIRDFLQSWQLEPGTGDDLAVLAAALADLKQACARADAARRDLDTLALECEHVSAALADIDQREARLFQQVGLELGDVASLQTCSGDLVRWQACRQQWLDASARQNAAAACLAGHTDLVANIDTTPRSQWEARRDERHGLAEQYDIYLERIAAINKALIMVGDDLKLEEATAQADMAKAKLTDAYGEAMVAKAAEFLFETVKKEYKSTHQPEVLRSARALLSSFTHGTYDLDIIDNHLLAYDRQNQAFRELAELSLGTRMQLLLATRMAWTKHLERQSVALPLFFDEALSSSDAQRFGAIVKSLQLLVDGEQRQIFYLSARHQDLSLWENALGRHTHVINLPAAAAAGTPLAHPDFELPRAATLPEPEGYSPAEYGRVLAAKPVDPRSSPGQIHLFHVLRDDLRKLHELMNLWHVASVGQLEGMLHNPRAQDALFRGDLQQKLAGRCLTTTVWVQQWRRGKGLPVGQGVLTASGAVSDKFIKDVSALAQSVNGDGQRLVGLLRDKAVGGFRQGKIDELEAWLKSQGYIDQEAPLSRIEREQQTLLGVMRDATVDDAKQVINWLENGLPLELRAD